MTGSSPRTITGDTVVAVDDAPHRGPVAALVLAAVAVGLAVSFLAGGDAAPTPVDASGQAALAATSDPEPAATAHRAPATDPVVPAGDGPVEIAMTEFAFDFPTTGFEAGEVTFRVRNDGVAPHQLAIGPVGEHAHHVGDTGIVDAGGVAELTVDLAPGTYEVGCHVPGHYEAGMATTITVV